MATKYRKTAFRPSLSLRKSVVTEPRKTIDIGRNDPCPCGSGKKYKQCCISKGDHWLQKMAKKMEKAKAKEEKQKG